VLKAEEFTAAVVKEDAGTEYGEAWKAGMVKVLKG